MDRINYLLTCLSEECAEVIKNCTKAQRFGIDDYNPNDPERFTNRDKLVEELNDLMGIAYMLEEEGLFKANEMCNPELMEKKICKVERYMNYSRSKGLLE